MHQQEAPGRIPDSVPRGTPDLCGYARELSGRRHGPHDDGATAGAASLAAETIRYLSYATSRGGVTAPATVYAVTGELSAAAYRLTQVLAQLSDWLDTQSRDGRLGDDHGRAAADVTGQACTALMRAARHAADLAAALAAAQNLAGTLHPAAPAEEHP